VASKIFDTEPYYSKLEYILPEELLQSAITEQLREAKGEMDKIIREDSETLQKLAASANKESALDSSSLSVILEQGFALEEEQSQDKISFHYAHWIMSQVSLQYLAQSVIELSIELRKSCSNYLDGTGEDRRKAFADFIALYSDFKGYLINLRQVITQYYDNFVFVSNELDANQKQRPRIAAKSDLGYYELLAATKDLLLRGNRGRLAGFAVLRSAMEVYITRELFSLKNSQRYRTNQIIFHDDIPSIKSICKRIDDNPRIAPNFNTDSLKRMYAWQSIVAHRGILAEEYLTWFVYYHTPDILNTFRTGLKQHRDEILDKLRKDGIIKIK
jgi:hypothetical protein